jgi:U3 small nucleolar RNA-associated protein 23
MRHGRAKAARKTLRFFRINANIKPPYKVLVDGNFLVTAVKQKVPIRERLSRVLQNEPFELFTCRSILDEMMKQNTGELYQQARQLGLDECQIIESKSIPEGEKTASPVADSSTKKRKRGDDETTTASESRDHIRKLASEVDGGVHNRRGFLVATQDEYLSDELRNLPNVPLLRLSRGVLLLEAPSAASRHQSLHEEKGKQLSGGGTMTEHERDILRHLKDKERS